MTDYFCGKWQKWEVSLREVGYFPGQVRNANERSGKFHSGLSILSHLSDLRKGKQILIKDGRKNGGEQMEKRQTLTGDRYYKKIDMEEVYRQIDSGKSIRSIAKELGVSTSTLYRRHEKYQAMKNPAQEAEAHDSGGIRKGYSDDAGE